MHLLSGLDTNYIRHINAAGVNLIPQIQYFVSYLSMGNPKRQKNSRDSATLTSLAAKTMVVNWERSPHSAKNVKVKA